MPDTAWKIGDLAAVNRIVHKETAFCVVDEEHAAGHYRACAAIRVLPNLFEFGVSKRPGGGPGIIGGKQPGIVVVPPERRRAEQHPARRCRYNLTFVIYARRRAGDATQN